MLGSVPGRETNGWKVAQQKAECWSTAGSTGACGVPWQPRGQTVFRDVLNAAQPASLER